MLLRDAVMEAVIVSPNSCDANPAAVNGTHQMFHDVRDSKECLWLGRHICSEVLSIYLEIHFDVSFGLLALEPIICRMVHEMDLQVGDSVQSSNGDVAGMLCWWSWEFLTISFRKVCPHTRYRVNVWIQYINLQINPFIWEELIDVVWWVCFENLLHARIWRFYIYFSFTLCHVWNKAWTNE